MDDSGGSQQAEDPAEDGGEAGQLQARAERREYCDWKTVDTLPRVKLPDEVRKASTISSPAGMRRNTTR